MDVAASFGSCAHQILVSSEDGGGDDSQEKTDHVQHHRGPQQTVQVDHVPAAADPCELIVLCVVLCAGRQQWSRVTCAHVFITRIWTTPSMCSLCLENKKGTLEGCQNPMIHASLCACQWFSHSIFNSLRLKYVYNFKRPPFKSLLQTLLHLPTNSLCVCLTSHSCTGSSSSRCCSSVSACTIYQMNGKSPASVSVHISACQCMADIISSSDTEMIVGKIQLRALLNLTTGCQ